MNSLKEISKLIKEHQRFVLAGHVSPDGDCIGATIALGLTLKKMGKEARIFLESFLPLFHYLEDAAMISETPSKSDDDEVVIYLDASDKGRLGDGALLMEGQPLTIINVDHHASNDQYGIFNYVEAEASSTSEIIYNLIKELDVELDRDIARALYTGIIYDTGVFKHPNTQPSTHAVASELLTHDIGASDIVNKLFFTKSFVQTKLLGQVLSGVELIASGKVAIGQITLNEITAVGGQVSDVDGVVQYMAQIEGIETAAFLYEKNPGEIKVSLRSKKYFNVAEFASKFGGGGHVRAAGCTLKGTMEEAHSCLLDAFNKYEWE